MPFVLSYRHLVEKQHANSLLHSDYKNKHEWVSIVPYPTRYLVHIGFDFSVVTFTREIQSKGWEYTYTLSYQVYILNTKCVCEVALKSM